jgi:hypothetical protein
MNWKTIFSVAMALAWLVACSPAATPPPPTATPAPAAEPTATTPAGNTVSLTMGITAEGAFYLGSATAPVQMFDYSNFL